MPPLTIDNRSIGSQIVNNVLANDSYACPPPGYSSIKNLASIVEWSAAWPHCTPLA
jgi:hypothetical protein